MTDTNQISRFREFLDSSGYRGRWSEQELSSALDVAGQHLESGSEQEFGKLLMRTSTFEQVWHDQDVDGSILRRFGIAVGPAAGGTLRLQKNTTWIAHYVAAGPTPGYEPVEKAKPGGEFFHDCDRDDLGHCKPGTGGGKKPAASKPAAKPSKEPEAHPGAAHGSTVKVKPTKQMAAPRNDKGKIEPVVLKTQLTKQETGRVVEAGIRAYLRDIEGITDTVALNVGKTNESIDLFGDSMAPEVKGGLCSNSVKAQQWRITFSMELSKAEQAKYESMTDEQQKAWREKRQRDCLKRKLDLLKKLSKERGKEIKPVTYTGILNPDTKTIDIYRTDGYHQRVDWNDPKAKYLGSVEYSHAD